MTLEQSDWSGASAAPRWLKPTPWGLGKFLLMCVVIAAFGALLAVYEQDPIKRTMGLLASVLSGGLTILGPYRAAIGGLSLDLDDQGLHVGKTYYPWASIRHGFHIGRWPYWLITFTAAGKRKRLLSFYGMPSQALARLLDSYLPESLASQDFTPQRRE